MSDQFALYTNPKGQPVTHSSYSSRQTFKKCPREFELTRIQGWLDKEHRAAPLFGKCVESGLQAYEDFGRESGKGVERFEIMWNDVKTLPEFPQLKFTDTEGDWESLLRAGREMMRLYEVRAPFLPISTQPQALWQQVLRKKMFPGTEFDKLENKAIVDLLSFPRWDHPLLPKVLHALECEYQPKSAEHDQIDCNCGADKQRPLIIDIKTSGGDLETDLVALDPQLAEYAWMGRIPDIAFLWFVKRSHEIKTGSRVTLLSDTENWRAGFELTVLDYSYTKVLVEPAEGKKKAKYEDVKDNYLFVAEIATYNDYRNTLHGLRGKVREEAEKVFFDAYADKIVRVLETGVTKQRLQFAAARLTPQDMDEIGRDVAQTTVEMVRAHRDGYYPKLAGIRFPNEKCNYCSMRWICLNRPVERDQNLKRKGEEWLDGMEEE